MSSKRLTSLTRARDIRAARPRPDGEAMRVAYLELLKLSLCDLAGAGTVAVGRLEDGRACARDLPDDQRELRANGMDWPLNGLTMTGLVRLDDLQRCVEAAVRDGVEGDLIEAGSWRGGATMLMRATLDSLGADDRTVWVADSFQGFPSADGDGDAGGEESEDLPMFEFLSVPLDEVEAGFSRLGLGRGVRFVPGFFEDTMPELRGRRWSVIRLDGDTYEATRVTLECLYPGLAAGGQLIVDDYGALDECRRAVDDFRSEHGIAEPLEEVDWTCVRWRRETEPEPIDRSREGSDGPAPTAPPSTRGRPHAAIPTDRELQLERELDSLRGDLRDAERELAALRSAPLAGSAAWARRRRGRLG